MATIGNITFACDDPDDLADFWATALDGYVKEEAPPDLIEALEAEGADPNMAAGVVDADGIGPRLYFRKKAKTPTESIPIHLDVTAANREAEVERLVEAGATEVETKTERIGPYESTWTVMKDPEDNGFCVQKSRE